MTIDLDKLYAEQAINGKYRKLYAHLCEVKDPEWSATFSEIETIIGFKLPPEAREYRPWWSDTGFDQVRACLAAGARIRPPSAAVLLMKYCRLALSGPGRRA